MTTYCKDINEHAISAIVSTVNPYNMCTLLDIDFLHTLWTHLCEIYEDHQIFPFSKDLELDCLIPLAHEDCIPFDYDTLLRCLS